MSLDNLNRFGENVAVATVGLVALGIVNYIGWKVLNVFGIANTTVILIICGVTFLCLIVGLLVMDRIGEAINSLIISLGKKMRE